MYNFFLRPFVHFWFVPVCAVLFMYAVWPILTADYSPYNMEIHVVPGGFNVSYEQYRWPMLDRLWSIAAMCWAAFQLFAFGPRWFKTIRRMNYNRVSRIG